MDFFVSNYVGTTRFASLNLIMPFIMLFAAIGFMLGAGGRPALTALTLGKGSDQERANEILSPSFIPASFLGILCAVTGMIFAPKVAVLLGATARDATLLRDICKSQYAGSSRLHRRTLQTFLITAERPRMGLIVTVLAGVTNMILDALFMGAFRRGIGSAGFARHHHRRVYRRPGSSDLLFCAKSLGGAPHKNAFLRKALLKVIANGSSEFLSNISMSVVNMLYNWRSIRLAGENGVSAYGIIMYTNLIFTGVYCGYSMGVSPIAGYDLGARNTTSSGMSFRAT